MAEPAEGYGRHGELAGTAAGGAGLGDAGTAESTGTGRSYARAQARSRMDAVSGRVRERADDLKERATERVDDATTRAGGRVAGVARAIRRAGDGLRDEGEERLASLTDDLASQVERMGSYLEQENPGQMLHDMERMARGNPALFVGGTFAMGILLGRFLRADEPPADIVFEPEGDWGVEGGSDARGEQMAEYDGMDSYDAEMARDEGPYDIGGDHLGMTPGIENISGDHPSSPAPEVGRHEETPVRTPIAGRETVGPGVRTGSSGAASLDAGSAGPRAGSSTSGTGGDGEDER